MEGVMKSAGFTTTIVVDRSPEQAFTAINNVRGWWSGNVEGDTDRLGAEFTYRYQSAHRSTQKVTELVPGKKVVWHVLDSCLSFAADPSEWNGTDIVFEIGERNGKTEVRFTHVGLVSDFDCYDNCSNAWSMLVNGNLQRLIKTGRTQPDPFI
jgi:hypothetical protein